MACYLLLKLRLVITFGVKIAVISRRYHMKLRAKSE